MARQINKTDLAENDLLDIWLFIAESSEEQANLLINRVYEKAKMLLTHPEIGRPRSEVSEDARCFPVGNYIIFYQDTFEGILILRVLHGARDLESLV